MNIGELDTEILLKVGNLKKKKNLLIMDINISLRVINAY